MIKLLQREAQTYAASATGAEKLRSLGMEPKLMCGEVFGGRVAREVATASQMAKDLNLKVE
ncbi:MAG: hypothetical protein H0V63_01510 [Burkholderiaceae bacterium]|nr:hypothetical protein [Burkholderiaceae bacterium]